MIIRLALVLDLFFLELSIVAEIACSLANFCLLLLLLGLRGLVLNDTSREYIARPSPNPLYAPLTFSALIYRRI